MSYLEAAILGIIQGLTEFLPVSSSGHLIVGQSFLKLYGDHLTFDIAVHFGTLLSVAVVYRKVLLQIICENISFLKSRRSNKSVRLFLLVFIGSLPAAIVGIGFKSLFEQMFQNMWVVIGGFYFTGLALFISQRHAKGQMGGHFVEKMDNVDHIKISQALIVGAAQALAITPGVSRAGTTIAAGLMTGMNRSTAAFFSFMLAIPAIFGASLLELRHMSEFSSEEIKVFGFGLLVSFMAGLIGLKLVLAFVKEGRLHYFSYYVWSLATVLLIIRLN